MTAGQRLTRLFAGNWPVLVFVVLLAVLILLKGRFNGFDARSLLTARLRFTGTDAPATRRRSSKAGPIRIT